MEYTIIIILILAATTLHNKIIIMPLLINIISWNSNEHWSHSNNDKDRNSHIDIITGQKRKDQYVSIDRDSYPDSGLVLPVINPPTKTRSKLAGEPRRGPPNNCQKEEGWGRRQGGEEEKGREDKGSPSTLLSALLPWPPSHQGEIESCGRVRQRRVAAKAGRAKTGTYTYKSGGEWKRRRDKK